MSDLARVIPMSDLSSSISWEAVSPTLLPDAFLSSDEVARARSFRLPSYSELPEMSLYRDQVVSYVIQQVRPLTTDDEEPWLTPSMVNNYVKMKLVSAPVKKQYGRDQLARLIVICVFKQFLNMASIAQLFHIQQVSYPLDVAYNFVALEVNDAVGSAFCEGAQGACTDMENASAVTRETLLVHAAAEAFASKAYLMSYLRYAGFTGKSA